MDPIAPPAPPSGRPGLPWKLIGVGALVLTILSGAGYYASQPFFGDEVKDGERGITPDEDNASRGNPSAVANCPFPVTDVPELAVSYGLPEGWITERDGGTLAIMEDDRNLTAAFIYTAKLERDLSATEFLEAMGDVFRSAIEEAGGSFSLGSALEANATATATARATVEEGELAGVFASTKEPGFITFKAYWAPTIELAAKEPELKQVLSCFARTVTLTKTELAAAANAGASPSEPAATPATTYAGQYFSVYLPGGWRVTTETDSGIDTANADGSAGFSYAYATGTSGAIDHERWASERLGLVGISDLALGAATGVPIEIANYSIKAFPFSGRFIGQEVEGEMTVGVYNTPDFGLGSYGSAFWGIQLAEVSLWPSVSSTTQQMQDSLFTKDLGATRKSVTLPTGTSIDDAGGSAITSGYEYRSALDAQSKDSWSAGMRGYESYQSPSTGDTYDVPINAYNPSGPDGPGYYRQLPGTGGLEKLDPVAE